MKKKLDSRTYPLKAEEIDDFFHKHLPYRLFMLETHKNRQSQFSNDSAILTCLYESMQISCRMLLEFMGLYSIGENPPELKPSTKYFSPDGKNSYEVKITDLGGKFVKVDELSDREKELLAHTYMCGNRATAHLTHGAPFKPDSEFVAQSAPIIRRLLKENLEDITGREICPKNS